jgi:uncharacterized protein (TIGR02466 family)
MQTFEIFPTVIASSVYDVFDETEKKKLLNEEYKADSGFISTVDTYVLDKVPLLKTWIQSQLDEYARDVMCIDEKLKITQSWCLVHAGRPQVVYPHRHTNSIISGSFYVHAPENTQGITFHSNKSQKTIDYPLIEWLPRSMEEKPSWLRSDETFDVYQGKLMLFQSHVLHSVQSNNMGRRCVLAFNTWFENGVGRIEHLNRLD